MKQNINELKSKLIPLYAALRDDCRADGKLCPFLMQWGNRFPISQNEGIIFYGRATNGWFGTWNFEVFFSDDNVDRGWNRDDQMIWVEKQWQKSDDGYITNKSQFWNIIKGVSTRFYGNEWFDYVAWSNICKVASCLQGNPNDTVFYNTLENNIKIFHAELDFWSPKYIVFLTDGIKRDGKTKIDWSSDFINSLSDSHHVLQSIYEVIWDNEKKHKMQVYKIGEKYIILSLHPQGRKVELHKDAIIKIVENIELREQQEF